MIRAQFPPQRGGGIQPRVETLGNECTSASALKGRRNLYARVQYHSYRSSKSFCASCEMRESPAPLQGARYDAFSNPGFGPWAGFLSPLRGGFQKLNNRGRFLAPGLCLPNDP